MLRQCPHYSYILTTKSILSDIFKNFLGQILLEAGNNVKLKMHLETVEVGYFLNSALFGRGVFFLALFYHLPSALGMS